MIQDLILMYEDWMWKYSQDRVELARQRLALHRKAMKEGTLSPYLAD